MTSHYHGKPMGPNLKIWRRDEDTCQYCGFPGECIDHIIPKSYRRDNSPENLVIACNRCNTLAGSQFFSSFEEKRDWILSKRRPEILKGL